MHGPEIPKWVKRNPPEARLVVSPICTESSALGSTSPEIACPQDSPVIKLESDGPRGVMECQSALAKAYPSPFDPVFA